MYIARLRPLVSERMARSSTNGAVSWSLNFEERVRASVKTLQIRQGSARGQNLFPDLTYSGQRTPHYAVKEHGMIAALITFTTNLLPRKAGSRFEQCSREGIG